MKKFVSGFIIGALLFSFAGVFAALELNVIPNPFPVLIDGVKTEIEGYNINGSTYLKLRDFEKAGLGIDFVDKQVVITTKKNVKVGKNMDEVELISAIPGEARVYSINEKEYYEYGDLAGITYSKYQGFSLNSDYRTEEIFLVMPGNKRVHDIPYITVNNYNYIEKDYYINTILPLIEQEAE